MAVARCLQETGAPRHSGEKRVPLLLLLLPLLPLLLLLLLLRMMVEMDGFQQRVPMRTEGVGCSSRVWERMHCADDGIDVIESGDGDDRGGHGCGCGWCCGYDCCGGCA